jgi:hypothetical protein
MRKSDGRWLGMGQILCFLTRSPDIRGTLTAVLGAALLVGTACGSRTLGPQNPDAGVPAMCANVGCALPPLCSQGCTAVCGCCACAPGDRNGDLVCVGGCYAPLQSTDAGSDADGPRDARDDVHIDGWRPPAACLLPFEVGPCDAAIRVYAFVNGACVERVYGGCGGNGNRFSTLEECLATCEGRPAAFPCPAGRVSQEICIACGPAGGCGKTIVGCALTCDAGTSCPSNGTFCSNGVCQAAGCI